MKIEDLISETQRIVGAEPDGRPGPQTWLAIYQFIVNPSHAKLKRSLSINEVDAASEKVISTLLPEVRFIARALVQKSQLAGIKIKITSGTRSYKEQEELYAQGRTKPGKIATKMKAGYSNHNFGIAFDVGVFEGNTYIEDSPKYKAVGMIGFDLGLDWGGNWKNDEDEAHFQLRPAWAEQLSEKEMLKILRKLVVEGRSIYT